MKAMIPIPTGLSLPSDAETKPFSLTGLFIQHGDKLMALELGSKTVSYEGGEEGDEEEEEGGGYDEKPCGCQKRGGGHGDGGGFLVAIERAMKSPKRS
jgi:hypothetical protein